MLTPPSDHGLKTVKETNGALAERSPPMVRHLMLSILISPNIVDKPVCYDCIYIFRTKNALLVYNLQP